VDLTILFALAIAAAAAVLVLATLSLIGAFVAGLADHAGAGGALLRRPS